MVCKLDDIGGFRVGNSKFGRFIILGAIAGGLLSMLDRSTRQHVVKKSNDLAAQISHYSKNPDDLKQKIMETKDKYMSLYEQVTGDATYIKSQVDELKTLTPQVKDIVVNTKEAFVDSKEEIKDIVSESDNSPSAKKL